MEQRGGGGEGVCDIMMGEARDCPQEPLRFMHKVLGSRVHPEGWKLSPACGAGLSQKGFLGEESIQPESRDQLRGQS